MFSQLTLPIRLRNNATLKNFSFSGNEKLEIALQTFLETPFDFYLYLWGKAGVGCSHLLQAACQRMCEKEESAIYIPLGELSHLGPILLENLETTALVCLDDIEKIAGNNEWEKSLFHFYNRIQATGHRLLIAGKMPSTQLNFSLPDLQSRLNSGLIFEVQDLDDQQKIIVLQQRAQQRGLELPDEVAGFLLHRLPRDLPVLFAMLDKMDHASLQAQRRLTIPFVKTVLGL